MNAPTIKDLTDVAGMRVFVRLGVNAPVKDGVVADAFRINEVLSTIEFLRTRGAKIIAAGHIGRGPEDTLAPVAEYLNTKFPVNFVNDVYADDLPSQVAAMENGEVILLENLRRWPGEKDNDPAFAERLASLADIYVNDAFAASHRAHASIVGVPKHLPAYLGLQFADEIKHLSLALRPPHPFVFILGGAKFATKVPLMEKFTALADTVFIGGALANDFYEDKGYEIGQSHTDKGDINVGHLAEKENLLLPKDVLVENKNGTEVKRVEDVGNDDKIVDAGPETIARLKELIDQAELVLWNGPLGPYEIGFDKATKDLLNILAECEATTIIGGGDTAALVSGMGIADKFTFVSTGGGAMLDFLADGKLAGIEALAHSFVRAE